MLREKSKQNKLLNIYQAIKYIADKTVLENWIAVIKKEKEN